MRKLLIRPLATAAALSMLTAGAAHAQAWNPNAFWRGAPVNAEERIGFLQQRIDRGRRDGSLNRSEASRVTYELHRMQSEVDRMRYRHRGRLTPQERSRVQAQLDGLSRQIRWLRHDGW